MRDFIIQVSISRQTLMYQGMGSARVCQTRVQKNVRHPTLPMMHSQAQESSPIQHGTAIQRSTIFQHGTTRVFRSRYTNHNTN